MIIDLHVHSNHSDGVFSVAEILKEAERRSIGLLSITDHDSIEAQELTQQLAGKAGIRYICGVELNVTFSHPRYNSGKPVSLDFLGYNFDPSNQELRDKLKHMADYRERRATKIMKNLNREFDKEGISQLTKEDSANIQASVDGVLGRPHIADYIVRKGIVANRQEAFDKYLVKCDVPKFPLRSDEAAKLVRNAGGRIILAHPNDPHGTSLVTLTKCLPEQTGIITDSLMDFIDGIECWHLRNSRESISHYMEFAGKHRLLTTGGSDCHQKPVVMGTVAVPDHVALMFKGA